MTGNDSVGVHVPITDSDEGPSISFKFFFSGERKFLKSSIVSQMYPAHTLRQHEERPYTQVIVFAVP